MARTICWFSCGAASAVATKLTLKENPDAEVVYQDTGSEHPDNQRFLADCSNWFGKEIKTIKSESFDDIWDVFEKTRFLSGPYGARCTGELKRKVAENYLIWGKDQDLEIIGFTYEEKHRAERIQKQNNERRFKFPLIERELMKEDCLGILSRVGIEIPQMYQLGFNNNNCIGCPKGKMGYWNHIRKHFPDVFERMAKVERELNISINRKDGEKVFLDELDPNAGEHNEPEMSCGIFCDLESRDLKD